ncbi:hypothetical protein [Acinetobacter pittii]|uniref:hypothetical protein n=1 Tax=Acinetobacter pittii TaxID=48296 RepID=UPI00355C7E3F
MKLALLVYLANVVNGLSVIFGLIGFGFFVCAIWIVISAYAARPATISRFDDEDEKASKQSFNQNLPERKKKAVKSGKILAPICLGFFLASTLIPNEKTIYLMAGAYATEQIASNERVQKIGSDVLEVIENKLTELKGNEK